MSHRYGKGYVPGDFSRFSNAERVFAMQLYSRRLEGKLRAGEFEYPLNSDANNEVEDLVVKYTRALTAVTFDRDTYFAIQKRYQSEPEYREEIEAKIAGTWQPPKKERAKKVKDEVKE
jgi:hypothetical protein